MNNNASLANYGKSFQEKLSFLILEDRIFADRMMEVLKIEFLESKYLQWFVDKIFDYKLKFKAHPCKDTMETLIKSSIGKENELIQKQVLEYYARFSKTSEFDDAEFVKTESLDFCRKQKLHEAMLKAAGLLKVNSFDEIRTVIDSALKAGSPIDTGHDYIKDFEKRYVENVRFPISTGWNKIDDITNGGIGRKEYCLILGGTGSGKTFLMVHLGATALKQGYNVVFYTLELSPEVIGQRFDSCITGIPTDELKNNKEQVLQKISEVPGELRIKFFPKKSVGIAGIRNHIERLKMEGFVPDMIILDYLDLLKAGSQKTELRHELGETYDGFEALNQELNTVGISGSQINRTGYKSDVVSMADISEAFNKNFGSYLTIGLSRDPNDRMNNTAKLSICKNRNGPDGIVYSMFMDTANAEIKVLDVYNAEEHQETQSDPEEEKRRMREKYKKFKMKNQES
ncbi:MAG: hypothetical protein EB127_24665 [Alphaproteobacteria bacterium]|nr:hypothetical protein [Alphaproteobacteria bacterium]